MSPLAAALQWQPSKNTTSDTCAAITPRRCTAVVALPEHHQRHLCHDPVICAFVPLRSVTELKANNEQGTPLRSVTELRAAVASTLKQLVLPDVTLSIIV